MTPALTPGTTLVIERNASALPIAPELSVIVPCYNEAANVGPLVAKLDEALRGISWEVIFVDDNSPDGTADTARRIGSTDARVRCIRRIGRRGLASAVVEGALASSAPYVAVMDGDLQHDERLLPRMLDLLRRHECELVIASRHLSPGDSDGLASPWRHTLSSGGIRLAQRLLPVPVTDPMSGFFMLPQPLLEHLVPRLTSQGFKILLDILLSMPGDVRVRELPGTFRERRAGSSKLDILVLAQFVGLLLDKLLHGLVPLRFIAFAAVGALGLVVHLSVLTACLEAARLGFSWSQVVATVVAMAFNFQLNNQITYRDQRLRGPALVRGLFLFMTVCGLGAAANIGIARALYWDHTGWTIAGATGALVGLVWNYAVSATLVWRTR